MRIKVCGMTLPEQVNALDEMGVDFAGFIFYPRSPRYIGNKISAEKMKKIAGLRARRLARSSLCSGLNGGHARCWTLNDRRRSRSSKRTRIE